MELNIKSEFLLALIIKSTYLSALMIVDVIFFDVSPTPQKINIRHAKALINASIMLNGANMYCKHQIYFKYKFDKLFNSYKMYHLLKS